MSIAYLLVALGLGLLGGAVWALFWAVDAGQFDDLEAQGQSILEPGADAAPPHIRMANSASSSTTNPATASSA